MSFSHIDIPVERVVTNAARGALSHEFGFEDNLEFQDWERHFQDISRVEEFVVFYKNAEIDEDEKFLLMELILASSSDGDTEFLESILWQDIEKLLRKNSKVHAWSIWFWSCLDDESKLPYNDFNISPYMQRILIEVSTTIHQSNLVKDLDEVELATSFGRFWWKYFNNCGPVGYKLRTAYSDRWVRFHSLPESKRYPETDRELDKVIDRMNVLADEVLGHDTTCWLIANRYSNTPPMERDAVTEFGLNPCLTWLNQDESLAAAEMVAYVTKCSWEPIKFEELLSNIAGNVDSGVLWVSESTHAVFAPYDGGVDLILPDSNQATALALKHVSWLPPYCKRPTDDDRD